MPSVTIAPRALAVGVCEHGDARSVTDRVDQAVLFDALKNLLSLGAPHEPPLLPPTRDPIG
jgi:hypothetical protein